MIRGNDIESLVKLLIRRQVSLYHACQFLDFQSYLSLEGIPSRACLEENHLLFTGFETDGHDHAKGVWDKVFMNFSDFGSTFAKGGKGLPNAYGPILLEINPRILYEATDIAVCIQPVGGSGFDRESGSFKSVDAINNLFVNSVEDGYPLSTWVKFKDALRKEYQLSKVCDPDISCAVANGKLSLKYVNCIRVDPYNITGKSLQKWVTEAAICNGLQFPIRERASRRCNLYNELARLIARDIPSCYDLSQDTFVSEELRDWAWKIVNQDLEYQFNRYATYLRNGTLLQLL